MKKILCLLLIGSVLIAFTSCKKNCICTAPDAHLEDHYYAYAGINSLNCKEYQETLNVATIAPDSMYTCK